MYIEQKRVVFLVNHDIVIYNFRKELVKELLDNQIEVYVVSPYGQRIELLKAMGCKYINVNIERHGMNPIHDLSLLVQYYKILKKMHPVIVLSFTIKPNIYGGVAAQITGNPYIANITGLGKSGTKRKLQIFINLLYRVAFGKVKCIFFQNRSNMDFFDKERILRGKYSLLPGSGVNLDEFQPLEYPPKGINVFVFIGRIMKDKGIEEYLAAAAYFRKEYNNVKFLVCGFCEENYEDVLEECQNKGIVEYCGMLDDVRDILKISHCTVLPSYHEGMSNTLLESAAVGRPLLASDIPGCREIIEDGVNGFVFLPNDSQSLIEVMKKFIMLPYEQQLEMGLMGRKKVEREFDRKIVVEAYMKEIRKNFEGERSKE